MASEPCGRTEIALAGTCRLLGSFLPVEDGAAEYGMANRDVLAIGTSAGGVEALSFLAKSFRPDFPAAVLISIHLPTLFRSSLDEILSHAGPLPAAFANNGETMKKGRIYIAPPGSHLIVDRERLLLGVGPQENHSRPAIDPMLRSTAVCCAHRAVGVVLTGTLGDGASGLWTLGYLGGMTVVQDPRDAAFSEMPLTALNRAQPDHVVPLADVPSLLESVVHQPAGEPQPVPESVKYEVEIARSGRASMDDMDRIGRRSVLSCPDCGGVMWEINEGSLSRYRCHVGHAYTDELMHLAVDESLRRALASALRALDERVALVRKLEVRAADTGNSQLAESWARRRREFNQEVGIINEAIERLNRMVAKAAAE
jgi:two-component system, chemotaxis family, protein-glutamate methylesterase/glutaminase